MTAAPVTSPPVTSRHVAKGVGTTLLSRMGAVVELVSQPLYVAMFGLASFGLYTVLWAAVNLFENIFDLGMTSAMQRTVPQAKSDAEAAASLRAAMILGVGPCLAVAILAMLLAPVIAHWLNVAARDQPLLIPSIRLFAWALPLWAFVEIATSALRARHLFGAEIRLRIVWEQVIRLVLATTLWCAGLGLTGLFVAHLASLAITVLLSIRLLRRHFVLRHLLARPLFTPMFGETAKAGLSMLPANMVARLFGDAPSIVINMIIPGQAGAAAAALYTIARKISSLVQVVRTAFSYVLAPLASSAAARDMEQVRDIYGFTTRLTTVIVLPLTLGMAAMTTAILGMFGHGADVAAGAVVILLFSRGAEAIIGSSVPVLQVTSGYRRQFLASIAGLATYALAALVLAPLKPLPGMAGSVGLGLIVATAIPMAQLHLHDRLHPFGHGYGRVIARAALVAVGGGAIIVALSFLPDGPALILSLPVAVGAMWLSCRIALTLDDRMALGKTGRALRLYRAGETRMDATQAS